MNDRRSFSRSGERIDLVFQTQGKCFYCGNPLEKDWEADHFLPYSKGGKQLLKMVELLVKDVIVPKARKICLNIPLDHGK